MNTMTNQTYSTNHFFECIHTHFDIDRYPVARSLA